MKSLRMESTFRHESMPKGHVYLAVLESLGVVGESTIGGGILYPSPREALSRLGQLSPTSVASPLETRSRIQYFPAWVHELCRVGVGAKDLCITYQQQYTQGAWNEQPTLLSCVLSIKTLVELTAVGMPCETKQAALDSAMSLLVEELDDNCQICRKQNHLALKNSRMYLIVTRQVQYMSTRCLSGQRRQCLWLESFVGSKKRDTCTYRNLNLNPVRDMPCLELYFRVIQRWIHLRLKQNLAFLARNDKTSFRRDCNAVRLWISMV